MVSLSMKSRWEIVFLYTHRRGPHLSRSQVAREVRCTPNSVDYWLKRYRETGDVQDVERTGRPRKTSPKEDAIIIKVTDQNDEESSKVIAKKLKRKKVNVSDRTVRRRLNEAGLRSLAPTIKPLLTDRHRKGRLEWAKANEDRDWNQVIFTDETTIKLFRNKKRVWRRPGQRIVMRSVKHPVKVQVWGCISAHGFGKIVCFKRNLNANLLCKIYKNGLLPSAKLWFGSNSKDWLLQEDNDPKHRSKSAEQWREEHGVHRLPWPSQSPDQNCIENVWNVLKANVDHHKPSSFKGLVRAIKFEWKKLDPNFAKNLVDSMPKRIQALFESGGDYTMY
jgi:transposase